MSRSPSRLKVGALIGVCLAVGGAAVGVGKSIWDTATWKLEMEQRDEKVDAKASQRADAIERRIDCLEWAFKYYHRVPWPACGGGR